MEARRGARRFRHAGQVRGRGRRREAARPGAVRAVRLVRRAAGPPVRRPGGRGARRHAAAAELARTRDYARRPGRRGVARRGRRRPPGAVDVRAEHVVGALARPRCGLDAQRHQRQVESTGAEGARDSSRHLGRRALRRQQRSAIDLHIDAPRVHPIRGGVFPVPRHLDGLEPHLFGVFQRREAQQVARAALRHPSRLLKRLHLGRGLRLHARRHQEPWLLRRLHAGRCGPGRRVELDFHFRV
mmetsp:Transcript_112069/g.322124  ORF Transcript_112069/g.322124 Transcript_112069/m.322124 type:complete len:243 (-) Transcript_112069:128-856(-)